MWQKHTLYSYVIREIASALDDKFDVTVSDVQDHIDAKDLLNWLKSQYRGFDFSMVNSEQEAALLEHLEGCLVGYTSAKKQGVTESGCLTLVIWLLMGMEHEYRLVCPLG